MSPTAPSPLRRLADQSLDDHAEFPQAAAARLREALALLPGAPGDAVHLARVVEHVMLGHLDDAGGLAQALDALQPFAQAEPALADAVARGRLALRLLDEPPAADGATLKREERVRAHYNAALALSRRPAWGRMAGLVAAAAALAEGSGDTAAMKAYAALCNNIAGDLRYYFKPEHRSDLARVQAMLDAAHRARVAWEAAGGWMETERADYQLALCLAAAGQGAEAVACAQACLQRCEANAADACERFFAHEALAHAHTSADQPAAAGRARDTMAQLLAQIEDADTRAFAAPVLAEVERLLATRPA